VVEQDHQVAFDKVDPLFQYRAGYKDVAFSHTKPSQCLLLLLSLTLHVSWICRYGISYSILRAEKGELRSSSTQVLQVVVKDLGREGTGDDKKCTQSVGILRG